MRSFRATLCNTRSVMCAPCNTSVWNESPLHQCLSCTHDHHVSPHTEWWYEGVHLLVTIVTNFDQPVPAYLDSLSMQRSPSTEGTSVTLSFFSPSLNILIWKIINQQTKTLGVVSSERHTDSPPKRTLDDVINTLNPSPSQKAKSHQPQCPTHSNRHPPLSTVPPPAHVIVVKVHHRDTVPKGDMDICQEGCGYPNGVW